MSSFTINLESFNDWGGGRGCHKCVHVLRGDGTKIAPPGDLFDQPSGEMNYIWGKLADHIEDHVVLSPEGVVLVTSLGTESSYPRPPQSLKHSLPPGTVIDVSLLQFCWMSYARTLYSCATINTCCLQEFQTSLLPTSHDPAKHLAVFSPVSFCGNGNRP